MDLKLTGRVALVSGGSRGIGRAIAGALAAEGCDVMLVAWTEADLRTAAAEIAAASRRRILHHAADLRTAAACAGTIDAHSSAFGRLDILVAFLASPVGRQVHGADVFIDSGGQKSIL
ncbi:MAG: SDR family NAD(P)-dependent oxidoreductase [Alphaproteobacteria bacterium]|nr:SDR family NAD(P)-dependent oxidoreductase [Alphaproteobacteria bacterium]